VTTFLPKTLDPPEVTYIPATIDVNVSWFFSLKDIARAFLNMSKDMVGRNKTVSLDVRQIEDTSNGWINLDAGHESLYPGTVSFNRKLGTYVPLQNMDWGNTYIKGKIIYESCVNYYLKTRFYYVEPIEVESIGMSYNKLIDRDFDLRLLIGNKGASKISKVDITNEGDLLVTWLIPGSDTFSEMQRLPSWRNADRSKFPEFTKERDFKEKFKIVKINPITIIIDCRDDNNVEDLELFQKQANIYYADIQAKYPNVKGEILQDDKGSILGYYVTNPIIIGDVKSINLPDFYILKGTANDVLVDDIVGSRCGYGLFEDGQEKPHVFGTASFMTAVISTPISQSTGELNSYRLDPDNLLETLKENEGGLGSYTDYAPLRRLQTIYAYTE